MILRPMLDADRDAVAGLICDSVRAWYKTHRNIDRFPAGPDSCRLFTDVYEDLDPGCCILAIDEKTSRIMASCFYHPRSTHLSLGIMNVHPDFFGQRIASAIVDHIATLAKKKSLPLRLVSSAMNLDSFSCYSRAGFVPACTFIDMLFTVPADGFAPARAYVDEVRQATPADIASIVSLEKTIVGIEREKDIAYFIANKNKAWNTLVHTSPAGHVDGYLVSIDDPGCNMIGPGASVNDAVAIALLACQLDWNQGNSPVALIPVDRPDLLAQCYAWKARNIEIHFAQSIGEFHPINGVMFPTFMPETA